ncbi:ABC transporter permease subunit [Clostridium thermobutyricum]|uniref:sugar ABC transporter permease n=1 Tax=Clostridium thermobutyricum TaxID=29372 RepID=UPI0029421A92|nr:ABC transporter permease subunit [Clostridium thermobutyricum]
MSKKEKTVYKEKRTSYETRSLWISRIIVWVFILIVIFPVISVIGSSLAKGQVFVQTTLFPSQITFDNYINVIKNTNFLIWFKNSMIICIIVSLVQLGLSMTAAFAFSKLRFSGRKYGLMFLLILQMFPGIMTIPAILKFAYSAQLMDHMWAYILLLCGGSAFNIWLLKGYMDGIPNELIEAAKVDGASTWDIFSKILLPLSRNMAVVIFLFTFISTYSEYVFASALLKSPSHYTITTGLQSFITNNFSANWTQYSAAAVMASIPLVIMFAFSQKYIAEGLIAGSVKG